MSENYEITQEACNEAITQEIYIQAGFKSSICVLILNTGFEAVGNYCPIDVENVNINTGKERSKAIAMIQVIKHLEAISQWKKAVDDIREAEKQEEQSSIQEKDTTKNSTEPSNVKLTEKT
jgi:hypothetical protein